MHHKLAGKQSRLSLWPAILFCGYANAISAQTLKSTGSSTSRPAKVDGNAFVEVKQGPLQGKIEDGYVGFYGIPYAQPPIGDQRWRKPVPLNRWVGTLDATNLEGVPACVQDQRGDFRNISEDCLYLNIFMPSVETIRNSSDIYNYTPRQEWRDMLVKINHKIFC